MHKSAWISECGEYRYTLTREWDDDLPMMLFIMLNPSTADADHDDPTIKRCISFAKTADCGGIEVVNLFGFRATHTHDLKNAPFPVGDSNDAVLVEAAEDAIASGGKVVCAWGNDGCFMGRGDEVFSMLTSKGISPICLGTTKGGYPRHPLYLKDDTPMEEYLGTS